MSSDRLKKLISKRKADKKFLSKHAAKMQRVKPASLKLIKREALNAQEYDNDQNDAKVNLHTVIVRPIPKSRAGVVPVVQNGRIIAPDIVYYTLRNARLSPQKARLVLNEVKGEHIMVAEAKLATCKRKGARIIEKMLKYLLHEARLRGMNIGRLRIHGGWVDSGITLKRFMPAAQGRAVPIKKRYSHITLAASDV